MGSKRVTTICGTRGILNVKPHGKGNSSAKQEKAVTIVEPASVREKRLEKEKQRIENYKVKVNVLIQEQIYRRKKEFAKLKRAADSKRTYNTVKKWLLWLLLLWLLYTMVKASLCHAHNTSCQVFWYESVLALVFGCLTSTWEEQQPVY